MLAVQIEKLTPKVGFLCMHSPDRLFSTRHFLSCKSVSTLMCPIALVEGVDVDSETFWVTVSTLLKCKHL